MEHALRCNDIKCRVELRERALVTTCSHIFCIDCASNNILSGSSPERRLCPACQAHLPRPDDAMVTNLNPSEDYKTSVLSGLSPEAIMECAGRALSFWSYQMMQELGIRTWETHRCKVITERYTDLDTTLDKVINEANSRITGLENKVSSMTLDQDHLRRKNDELTQAYKDKNRKLLQTQELYDKLKRKAMLGQIQDAATDAVDTTLQRGVNAAAYPIDRMDTQGGYEQQFGTPIRSGHHAEGPGVMPPQPRMAAQDLGEGSWVRPALPPPQAKVPVTPSTHRQRPGADGLGLSAVPGVVAGTPVAALHGSGRMRQPSSERQHNQRTSVDNFIGVGLSSRLKASHASGPTGTFVPALLNDPDCQLSI
ncbi:E3 ubiquitin-protein ligase CCNB1IP1 [Cytospora mali]|uniref:E3 ubiquitin-protein ligase CCNB1IP1 n=1 Tax=Cytospora mali TaxID=578113 RepID=A0A194VVZ1_CYTMA|nr:E3 ubiquitin-protein ligase CCNB1IP1 [Valsa mali]